MPSLPPVGSADLLDRLSAYVPDQLIAALVPRQKGRGRRADFSSIQLFRILLRAMSPHAELIIFSLFGLWYLSEDFGSFIKRLWEGFTAN